MVRRGKTEKQHNTLVVVVEGAGQDRDLSTECRRAFSLLVEHFGVNRKPRFVCGGGRSQAYDKFKIFIERGVNVILLIDSEAPVGIDLSPWTFLKDSGVNWEWLDVSMERDADCHFMVQCMENWIIASSTTLKIGGKNVPIQTKNAEADRPESITKGRVFSLLKAACRKAGQREYSKGDHSFAFLERIDVDKLCHVSPWAKRFFDEVRRRCC